MSISSSSFFRSLRSLLASVAFSDAFAIAVFISTFKCDKLVNKSCVNENKSISLLCTFLNLISPIFLAILSDLCSRIIFHELSISTMQQFKDSSTSMLSDSIFILFPDSILSNLYHTLYLSHDWSKGFVNITTSSGVKSASNITVDPSLMIILLILSVFIESLLKQKVSVPSSSNCPMQKSSCCSAGRPLLSCCCSRKGTQNTNFL